MVVSNSSIIVTFVVVVDWVDSVEDPPSLLLEVEVMLSLNTIGGLIGGADVDDTGLEVVLVVVVVEDCVVTGFGISVVVVFGASVVVVVVVVDVEVFGVVVVLGFVVGFLVGFLVVLDVVLGIGALVVGTVVEEVTGFCGVVVGAASVVITISKKK